MKLLTKDVVDIIPPQLERVNYETWPDEHGFEQSIPIGPIRRSNMKLVVATEEAIAIALWHFGQGTVLEFDIHDMQGTAYVIAVMTHSNGRADVELRLTGPVRFNHPNCRCNTSLLPVKEAPMMKRTKVLNRFYVASDKMMSQAEQGTVNEGPQRAKDIFGADTRRHARWAKRDLKTAIDHAREILEQDPNRQEVAVVRIVKVVRRKPMPIIVEDVK